MQQLTVDDTRGCTDAESVVDMVDQEQPAVSGFGRTAIVARSLAGVRWTFVLAPLGAIVSYLVSVLLGRASPQALGAYSAFLIGMTLASTFLFLGGSNVIVNFLPKLRVGTRLGFLLTYAAICVVFAVPWLGIIVYVTRNNTEWLPIILGGSISVDVVLAVVVLFPLVLAQTFMLSVLNAQMSVGAAVLVRVSVPIATFASLLLIVSFDSGSLQRDPFRLIAAVVITAFAISCTLGLVMLARGYRFQLDEPVIMFLPPGFWRFTIPFYVNCMLVFLLGQVDQLAVFRIIGIEDLGLYRAALVTASLATWFPNTLMGALYPGFCHMATNAQYDLLRQAYTKSVTVGSFLCTSVALFLVLFSNEILLAFGRSYIQASLTPLLVLSAGFAILSPLHNANGALIVALGRTDYHMLPNLVGAAGAVSLSLLLVPRLGLTGAALAAVLSLALVTLSTSLLVRLVGRMPIPASGILLWIAPAIAAWGLGVGLIPSALIARLLVYAAALLGLVVYVIYVNPGSSQNLHTVLFARGK